MTPERFNLLTRRHRECLRGVRELKGSKEIAAELGLGKSTVDGYLTEAVRLLGARNRRDAALMLAEHEASIDQDIENEQNTYPDKVMPDSARLVAAPEVMPIPSAPDGSTVGGVVSAGHASALPRLNLPIRRRGQHRNDMGLVERLLWIPTIAVGLAIGFGMLATGLDVMTRVIDAVASHAR